MPCSRPCVPNQNLLLLGDLSRCTTFVNSLQYFYQFPLLTSGILPRGHTFCHCRLLNCLWSPTAASAGRTRRGRGWYAIPSAVVSGGYINRTRSRLECWGIGCDLPAEREKLPVDAGFPRQPLGFIFREFRHSGSDIKVAKRDMRSKVRTFSGRFLAVERRTESGHFTETVSMRAISAGMLHSRRNARVLIACMSRRSACDKLFSAFVRSRLWNAVWQHFASSAATASQL